MGSAHVTRAGSRNHGEPRVPKSAHHSGHYLGLELSGAKNQKTSLAVLEYFPKERKIFLLEIYEKIAPAPASESRANEGAHSRRGGGNHNHELHPSDAALLELIGEFKPEIVKLGVNVPLTLPPAISASKSASAWVRWMREEARRASQDEKSLVRQGIKPLDFTTYTQRPIELWVRYEVMPKLPKSHRFEIDEALGGNKAPLTARMHFLKSHLEDVELIEAWPKLTIALLALELGLERRTIARYRHLEEGVQAREDIIDALTEQHGIFIYERDVRKLAQSLPSFDAFMCAYTALLSDLKRCEKAPRGFPVESGWIEYPRLGRSSRDE